MKTLIVLILLLPMTIFGQLKPSGKYNWLQKTETYHFIFLNDSMFEYHHIGPTVTANNGRGNYIIKGDSIIMKFVEYDSVKNEIAITNKPCNTDKGSAGYSVLDFTITDYGSRRPMIRTIISIRDPKMKFINQVLTDSMGKASIKVKNGSGDYNINIYFDGLNTHNAKVRLNGCKDIKYDYPRTGHLNVAGSTVWRFKIKELSKQRIILQDGENEMNYEKAKE